MTRTSSSLLSRSKTRSSAPSTSRAYLYDLFGMEARFELSTRPDNKLGTDEEWDFTEAALRNALDRRSIDYTVSEGEGAFYGPKIDLHMDRRSRAFLANGHDPARLADAGSVRPDLRR